MTSVVSEAIPDGDVEQDVLARTTIPIVTITKNRVLADEDKGTYIASL